MKKSKQGGWLHEMQELANMDLDNGDYVVMARSMVSGVLLEELLTFSGVTIYRKVPRYARYAPTQKGCQACQKRRKTA